MNDIETVIVVVPFQYKNLINFFFASVCQNLNRQMIQHHHVAVGKYGW